MVFDQLQRAMQNTQEFYAKANSRLGMQKKILSPSEDVSGALRALDYQVNITANDQFARNVNAATTNLNLSDSVLSSSIGILAQLKEIVFKSLDGIQDATVRTAYSQKAAQLRDQLVGLANTEVGGRFLFSGFSSDTRPYNTATYAYQGDAGVVSVPIDHGVTMATNLPGSDVFSYTLGAAYVKQTAGGLNVHYTPGAGSTVNVEIRDAADTAVLDTFSFSTVMQMTDILSSAVAADDVNRVQALLDPFNRMQEQTSAAAATIGARLSGLNDQSTQLGRNTNALRNSLSTIMDIDMTETAMQLQKADTTLQALYSASAKIMSQSLLDFLQ